MRNAANKSLPRFTAVVIAFVAVMGLAGCGARAPLDAAGIDLSAPAQISTGQDTFEYAAAEATMRAGMKGVLHRYIDPVQADELALNGLRGLSAIAPGFALSIENGMIQVKLDGALAVEFPRPEDADAAMWAALMRETLRIVRGRSPDLKSADNERTYEAVFDGMLGGLDAFSRYASAEQAQLNRARRDGYGGIGIRFRTTRAAGVIAVVEADSPAQIGGLRPGDRVVAINDLDTSALSIRQIVQHLRGPVGSSVTLTIARARHGNNQSHRLTVTLNRTHIVQETVQSKIQDQVMRLTISSFNKNTAASLRKILSAQHADFETGRLKGVVMDLRGNPGGLLSQSVSVADLFLNQGRIIATRGRHPDSFHDYRAGGSDMIDGKPLVVLVDGNSASAAEIVASALQDLGRAVVVGSASYGKGTVQTVLRLPNDGELTLTWSRLVSPSGYALHRLGVMPTVCATNTPDGDARAILAPQHIARQRQALSAWRAAGMIFDGRRAQLRGDCPAQIFKIETKDDLLMQLAGRVLDDPGLYQQALMGPAIINTAARR